MTTQEFVKKESDIKYPLTTGQPAEADSWNEAFNEVFSDGLTKGLEITKELIMSISGCKEQTAIKYIEDSLTEKYGK